MQLTPSDNHDQPDIVLVCAVLKSDFFSRIDDSVYSGFCKAMSDRQQAGICPNLD